MQVFLVENKIQAYFGSRSTEKGVERARSCAAKTKTKFSSFKRVSASLHFPKWGRGLEGPEQPAHLKIHLKACAFQ